MTWATRAIGASEYDYNASEHESRAEAVAAVERGVTEVQHGYFNGRARWALYNSADPSGIQAEPVDGVEWGIVHRSFPDALHRGPMAQEDAEEWMSEWIADGGLPEAFYIVSRKVTPWEVVAHD